jgi:integrase
MSKPKISKTKFRNGTLAWCVNFYWPNGKQYRRFFADFDMAKADLARVELELEDQGKGEVKTFVRQSWLTQSQLTSAEQSFTRLANAGLTTDFDLLEAVEHYIGKKQEQARIKEEKLSKALDAFVADKRKNGRSIKTTTGLKNRLTRFVEESKLTEATVTEVTTEHIKNWLAKFDDMMTKRTERAVLSNFFNWALECGFVTESPVAKTEDVIAITPLPEILSLEAVKKMLNFASTYRDGITLPYMVLGVFCGLRPSEIEALTWEKIDLVNNQIEIDAEGTKLRQRRTVDIPSNARILLELCEGKPLLPPRRVVDALKRAGGFQGRAFISKASDKQTANELEQSVKLPEWPEDALRHTAITYHFAKSNHEGETAVWAGNSPDIIHKHYKGRIKGDRKKAVAEFWSLKPSNVFTWTDPDENEPE